MKPSRDQTAHSATSNISNTLTTKNIEEKRDVFDYGKQQNNNEETLDLHKTTFSTIGPPSKTSTQMTQIKSVENKLDNTTNAIFPSPVNEKLQRKSSSISGNTESNNLDPELTLGLLLSPPSKCSTPQGLCFDEEPKKFALAFSPPQTSPPILTGEDSEGLRCTRFSPIPLMEGEVPEQTQPQSPTILTRSHSVTRTIILAAASSEHRTPKRKRNDLSFGSILTSKSLGSKQVVNERSALGETITRIPSENESRKQLSNVSQTRFQISSKLFKDCARG